MDLSPTQRRLLTLGVRQWQLPGHQRAGAPLLGVPDVPAWSHRVAGALENGADLSADEWERALLATELAFGSHRLGYAIDWFDDTGMSDRDTASVLRSIQQVFHYGARWREVPGCEPSEFEPAWLPMSFDEDEAYWKPFTDRYGFRPGATPAIIEPEPSVTFSLEPMFRQTGAPPHTRADALDALALCAFTEIVAPGERMVVLDWQHQCHWFDPHLQAHRPRDRWPTGVFPNGDYYIFLTEDLSSGTFGHPWERTLCVFGEPLLAALAPLLTGWLPVERSRVGS